MFRQLTDRLWVSPQISVANVADAATMGITLIINNRPEGESDNQTAGDDIAAAASAQGIVYAAIPVTHSGFSRTQVTAMCEALASTQGKILAYCRSGTRSTLLLALAQASEGADLQVLTEQAARVGYDLGPVRAMMDMLASAPR